MNLHTERMIFSFYVTVTVSIEDITPPAKVSASMRMFVVTEKPEVIVYDPELKLVVITPEEKGRSTPLFARN